MAATATLKFLIFGEDVNAAKTLRKVAMHADTSSSSLTNLGKVGAAAAITGLGAAAAAATALGVKAVNLAANFEQSQNVLQKSSGATADEMKKLDKLAKDMGNSTVYSAQDASDAMVDLSKAGLKVKEIMGGGVQSAMSLAATEGINMADAATTASNAMHTFGLKAKDLPAVADALAGASNASTASVTSLSQALAQVGPGAKNAGLSLNDTVGVLAAFDNAGIKGSDAGTSLKTMLTRLVPMTSKAFGEMANLGIVSWDGAKAMQSLGELGIKPLSSKYDDVRTAVAKYVTETQGLQPGTKDAREATDKMMSSLGAMNNAFIDSHGNFKNITEIAQVLKEKLGGLSQEEQTAALATIFGSDATRAATILTKEGAEGLARYITATKQKGAAEDMASARTKGFAGSMEALKGSLETIGISVGQAVIPVLTKLVVWINEKLIPGATALFQQVMPKLREAFDRIKQVIDENRPQLEKLGQELAAIGAVIVTKVLPVLIDLWKNQMSMVIKVLAQIGDKLPVVASFFIKFAATAVGAFGTVVKVATDSFASILTAAEKGLGWIPGIGDKIKGAKAAFDDWRTHTVDRIAAVKAGLESAADKIDDWNRKANSASEAKIKADIADLKDKIDDAKTRLRDPNLTDPERAKIKADITDLKDKVAAAKDELVTVKDRTVTVTVNLKANQVKARTPNPDEGKEPHGGGGESVPVSGAGVTKWTHGKGHPGAGWYQKGNWTWAGGHHNGVDVTGVGSGTRVYSTRSGVITHAGYGGPEGGWAGNNVIEDIGGGVELVFAHLSQSAKSAGAHVSGGDLMGFTGSTGRSFGAHLHVSARRGGTYVNPLPYLASGGIVRSRPGGSVVVAGEAGQDEAVIPLPSGWQSGSGGVGSTIININVSGGLGDREAVARDVKLALLDLKRRSGATLGLA